MELVWLQFCPFCLRFSVSSKKKIICIHQLPAHYRIVIRVRLGSSSSQYADKMMEECLCDLACYSFTCTINNMGKH